MQKAKEYIASVPKTYNISEDEMIQLYKTLDEENEAYYYRNFNGSSIKIVIVAIDKLQLHGEVKSCKNCRYSSQVKIESAIQDYYYLYNCLNTEINITSANTEHFYCNKWGKMDNE